MNDWEKFNETSLPEEEDFYSHSNITNADYHDLYVQSDVLLLVDLFQNF